MQSEKSHKSGTVVEDLGDLSVAKIIEELKILRSWVSGLQQTCNQIYYLIDNPPDEELYDDSGDADD